MSEIWLVLAVGAAFFAVVLGGLSRLVCRQAEEALPMTSEGHPDHRPPGTDDAQNRPSPPAPGPRHEVVSPAPARVRATASSVNGPKPKMSAAALSPLSFTNVRRSMPPRPSRFPTRRFCQSPPMLTRPSSSAADPYDQS